MKNGYLAIIGMILLGSCSASQSGSQSKELKGEIFPATIHHSKMDNELNVVTVPFESPGLAAFYIIVRVGSREEIEAGKTGFAHFFEHMMFRGTDKYSKDEYGEALKSIGAGANANTWLDRTVYHMTGNADKLELMFELEADRFQHLNYSVPDFKVEAGAVKGEYTKNFASPFRQLDEKLNDVAFEKHTYKHTTMGFFEDIVDMPNQYEYSLEFYKKFYRPEYSTILVVGDVTHDQVMALSEKYFGNWEKGDYRAEIPVEPAQTETRFAHIQSANFNPTVHLAHKGPAFADTSREVAAIELLSTILFSQRSDLYKKLVVTEQKVLNLYNYMYRTRDPHLIQTSAICKDAGDLQYVKDEILAAFDDVAQNGIDAKLLDDTKKRSKYAMLMDMDNPESIAESLSYFIWVTGDPASMDTYLQTMMSVTQEDLQAAIKKFIRPEGLTIATIGPDVQGGVQ